MKNNEENNEGILEETTVNDKLEKINEETSEEDKWRKDVNNE